MNPKPVFQLGFLYPKRCRNVSSVVARWCFPHIFQGCFFFSIGVVVWTLRRPARNLLLKQAALLPNSKLLLRDYTAGISWCGSSKFWLLGFKMFQVMWYAREGKGHQLRMVCMFFLPSIDGKIGDSLQRWVYHIPFKGIHCGMGM